VELLSTVSFAKQICMCCIVTEVRLIECALLTGSIMEDRVFERKTLINVRLGCRSSTSSVS
jgi:hypothetical protein